MSPLFYAMPGNEELGRKIARAVKAETGHVLVRRFPDGEAYVRVEDRRSSVRRNHIVVVCTLDCPDAKILPLWFLAKNLQDLGARSVGLVCPYLPYMRQDNRFKSGEALTSVAFAEMMSTYFDWMVTVDPHLHRHKSLGAVYSIPTTVVHAAALMSRWIRDRVRRPIVVGPDEESEQWVSSVAAAAGAPFVVLRKVRTGDRSVKVTAPPLVEIARRTPVVVDDIISTAHTMIETVRRLRHLGSARPTCVGVHGLFADAAYGQLRRAGAGTIATCNTVHHRSNQIDVSELLVPAVKMFLGASRSPRVKSMNARPAMVLPDGQNKELST